MLSVYNMVLEVTRRCNMACAHCLRGEAQCVDMSNEVIAHALSGVPYISSLTLTGGEPSLAVPTIRHIIDTLKRQGTKLGSFYIVTNGLEAPMEFVHCLVDLYALCNEVEDGMCGLAVSEDQYHGLKEVPSIYEALTFYRRGDKKEMPPQGIINSGRAYENGLGMRDNTESEPTLERYDDGTLYVEEPALYVSANGNVIFGCDYSYEHIDEECIGNVTQKLWSEILAPYEPKEEAA